MQCLIYFSQESILQNRSLSLEKWGALSKVIHSTSSPYFFSLVLWVINTTFLRQFIPMPMPQQLWTLLYTEKICSDLQLFWMPSLECDCELLVDYIFLWRHLCSVLLMSPCIKLQLPCTIRWHVCMVLSFMTWNPFFLFYPMSLENVIGLILWNQTYQKHLSLGTFCFFPSNEFGGKICCSVMFMVLITSGSARLESYILDPDLATGLRTHTYIFLIDRAIWMFHWSSTCGRSEIIFTHSCSSFHNVPAPPCVLHLVASANAHPTSRTSRSSLTSSF